MKLPGWPRVRTVISGAALLACVLGTENCGSVRVPLQGPPAFSLQGNWQFTLTPTSGSLPFASLAGALNEQGSAAGPPTLAAPLQIGTPSGCFSPGGLLPFHGQVQGQQASLDSFSYSGQFINIAAGASAQGLSLSGSYHVVGGCADGESGTLLGTKYQPLSGVFSGTVPGATTPISLTLRLTQSPDARGDGFFDVSGSAAFSGVSCFAQGTLLAPQDGAVLGSMVELTFSTEYPAGAQVILRGTFDPGALAIQLQSVQISGGSCAGALGPLTLTRT